MAFELADQTRANTLEALQRVEQGVVVPPEEQGGIPYDEFDSTASEQALVADSTGANLVQAEEEEIEETGGNKEQKREMETNIAPVLVRVGAARRRSSIEIASRPKQDLQAEMDELKRLRHSATRSHASLDRQIEKLQRGLMRIYYSADEISLQDQLQNLSKLKECEDEENGVRFSQDEAEAPTTVPTKVVMISGSERQKKIRSRKVTKMVEKGDDTADALAAARADAAARKANRAEDAEEEKEEQDEASQSGSRSRKARFATFGEEEEEHDEEVQSRIRKRQPTKFVKKGDGTSNALAAARAEAAARMADVKEDEEEEEEKQGRKARFATSQSDAQDVPTTVPTNVVMISGSERQKKIRSRKVTKMVEKGDDTADALAAARADAAARKAAARGGGEEEVPVLEKQAKEHGTHGRKARFASLDEEAQDVPTTVPTKVVMISGSERQKKIRSRKVTKMVEEGDGTSNALAAARAEAAARKAAAAAGEEGEKPVLSKVRKRQQEKGQGAVRRSVDFASFGDAAPPTRVGAARRRSSIEIASRPKQDLQAEIDELKRLRHSATRSHASLDREIEKLQRGLMRSTFNADEISLQDQLQNLSKLKEGAVKFEQDEAEAPTTVPTKVVMISGSERQKKIRSRKVTKMVEEGDGTSNALAAARADAAARKAAAADGDAEEGGQGKEHGPRRKKAGFAQDEAEAPTTVPTKVVMISGSERQKKIRSRKVTKMVEKGDGTADALAAARADAAARKAAAADGDAEEAPVLKVRSRGARFA
jgi:hypothetical protein